MTQPAPACPCVCHTGGAFRPACDTPGGCGQTHRRGASRVELADADGALLELLRALPDLERALEPGRTRTWPRMPTSDQAEAREAEWHKDQAARTWLIRHGLNVLAATPAPMNLRVSDTRAHIDAAIAQLDGAVCDALGLTRTAGDTRARILRLRGLLDATASYPQLAAHVCDETCRIARAAATALEPPPHVPLGAPCPHCAHLSLLVDLDRELISCRNRECRCPIQDCACHQGRRHTWSRDQWANLAAMLTTPA